MCKWRPEIVRFSALPVFRKVGDATSAFDYNTPEYNMNTTMKFTADQKKDAGKSKSSPDDIWLVQSDRVVQPRTWRSVCYLGQFMV
eukprot:748519-Hanusia_phi.AAC.2